MLLNSIIETDLLFILHHNVYSSNKYDVKLYLRTHLQMTPIDIPSPSCDKSQKSNVNI